MFVLAGETAVLMRRAELTDPQNSGFARQCLLLDMHQIRHTVRRMLIVSIMRFEMTLELSM